MDPVLTGIEVFQALASSHPINNGGYSADFSGFFAQAPILGAEGQENP